MPCAWQLKMGSPIPGDLMVLIRHNTVRGYNKHREEGQGEMLPVCPVSSLLFLLNTVRALHSCSFLQTSCWSVTLQLLRDGTALAGKGSSASPGQAEPSTLELTALLKSCEVHEIPPGWASFLPLYHGAEHAGPVPCCQQGKWAALGSPTISNGTWHLGGNGETAGVGKETPELHRLQVTTALSPQLTHCY